jgi:hypothetical protein
MKLSVLYRILIGCLLMGIFHLPTSGTVPAEASDYLLSMPSANYNLDPDLLVPMEVVEQVALKKAQELWSQVTPGEPIPTCDENGDIVAYMCPFYIGSGAFPSYEQIMEGVKEGRDQVKAVQIGFFNLGSTENSRSDSDTAHIERRAGGDDASTTDTADSKPSRMTAPKQLSSNEGESYQEALKAAKEKELGIGEYGTIYVSARYDRYPIRLCSHYLSPFYFRGDLAQENAAAALGSEPHLSRYYFLGFRGQYFEFVSGQKKTIVHAYSLDIESFEPFMRRLPSAEQLEDMRNDWDKLTGSAEAEKGGDS